jgi:hypothetical protein
VSTTTANGTTSLAASTAFRTFAIVFAIATPIVYTVCEIMNWPLFTYHPGTNRVNLGFARPVPNEGPAMYWYGWTTLSLLASAALGFLVTLLPQSLTRRIPLSLVWVLPIIVLPILIYSLKFFWRW